MTTRDETTFLPADLTGVSHVMSFRRLYALGFKETTLYRDIDEQLVWATDTTNPSWRGSDDEALPLIANLILGDEREHASLEHVKISPEDIGALLTSEPALPPPHGAVIVVVSARLAVVDQVFHCDLRWLRTAEATYIADLEGSIITVDNEQLVNVVLPALNCSADAVGGSLW